MAALPGYWEHPRVQIWGLTDEETRIGRISNERVQTFARHVTRCTTCRWPMLILHDNLPIPKELLCSECNPWLGVALPERPLSC